MMAASSSRLVLFFVLSWLCWLVVAAVLVASAALPTRIVFVVLSALWIIMVLAAIAFSVIFRPQYQKFARTGTGLQQKPVYNRNLGNTVITLLLATAVLPALYWSSWYHERNRNVITLDRDTVKKAYFPAITLFQQRDWTSQADLDVSARPKCFIGPYNETAPECGTVEDGLPCQCHNRWAEDVVDFDWQNTSYRALTLTSSKSMVSVRPTSLMIAQAFFTYNRKQALDDSSHILSPSLWIAIYDPTLTLENALETGYAQMRLINANGMTNINIGLNRREALGHKPANDYHLSFSTIPATGIQCDVSSPGGAAGLCWASLFLQFPTFEITISTQSVALNWQEVVSMAGSWFALFQLMGWILSGLAWYKGG
ncbi:hypothetical protein QBC43DRAFT_84348 [Cladorrhinum sp. PSN259]|nr:hypothetical protein QBC43DRAFT_84348 [Cladorrhinum sp. PSN259]